MAEPYVPAVPEVPVRVTVAGEQHDGQVLGWRGDRVYVRYRGPQDGNHLAWVEAGAVQRLET